jgi:uncharacterized protein
MFIQEMSERDCCNALTRAKLGRLACARDNQPYLVPVYIAYEEPYLYGFTTLGQKVEWMRSNPLVCVEVDEVENSDQWTSILIFGRYEELPGALEGIEERRHVVETRQPTAGPTRESIAPDQHPRRRANELLQEHAEWWEPGCTSRTHLKADETLTTVFYRILIDRITGRRARPSRAVPGGIRKPPSAGERPSLLRRLFHALFKPSQKSSG